MSTQIRKGPVANLLLLGAMAAGCSMAADESRKIAFDTREALKAWTTTGDVTIDLAKARDGQSGALKVGPGGKALLQLRDADASGKVEVWVWDDGSKPENAKVNRVGPRWGLVQSDGRVFTIGIMYAPLPGGDGRLYLLGRRWGAGEGAGSCCLSDHLAIRPAPSLAVPCVVQ